MKRLTTSTRNDVVDGGRILSSVTCPLGQLSTQKYTESGFVREARLLHELLEANVSEASSGKSKTMTGVIKNRYGIR